MTQKQDIIDCIAARDGAAVHRIDIMGDLKHIPPHSVDAVLSQLLKAGKVVRTSRGYYRLPPAEGEGAA